MPAFLVTFPDSAAVPVIGTDEVDAVAGALQSLDSLRDVIALCADTVPEMAAVCERAAPRASAAQPWPEAAAIRAVVAWWMGRHPEIVVAPDTARAAFPMTTLSLDLLDTYDFASVFGEDTNGGNTPALDFTRADVVDLYLCEEGENDGAEWRAVGRLRDGRYFRATGGCDYTGWDCQASNSGETWPDLATFTREIGDDDRAKLGLGLDGLGSMVVPSTYGDDE